ncbi:MAG: hypothetical protein OER12_08330 [Acidimicrobiia bacterium]|nr:hypothetical protein [Acidimicrobiia bacterium]
MRQIRPRTSYPSAPPSPVPTDISIDLRTPEVTLTVEQLREEICSVREEIAVIVDHLSSLVEKREQLKNQLLPLQGAQDKSVVAWGFCEDDDL